MTSDFAPQVPEIPQTAIGFAQELGALAAKYDLRDLTMDIRINTGVGSQYWRKDTRRDVQETMTVTVSRIDGRGRPRTKIAIQAKMDVRLFVVHEPDSSN